jgi:hypothetical protein
MQKILSFDCGIYTTSYCLVEIMTLPEILVTLQQVNKLMRESDYVTALDILKALTNNMIKIIDYNPCIDLDPTKKLPEIDRISNLIAILQDKFGGNNESSESSESKESPINAPINAPINSPINSPINDVLVEYQMKLNTTSPAVYYCLLTYFISAGYKTHSVHAGKKNKITYDRANIEFRAEYASGYYANKKHSVHNATHLMTILGRGEDLKKMKCKKDFSDSLMQIIGWLNH